MAKLSSCAKYAIILGVVLVIPQALSQGLKCYKCKHAAKVNPGELSKQIDREDINCVTGKMDDSYLTTVAEGYEGRALIKKMGSDLPEEGNHEGCATTAVKHKGKVLAVLRFKFKTDKIEQYCNTTVKDDAEGYLCVCFKDKCNNEPLGSSSESLQTLFHGIRTPIFIASAFISIASVCNRLGFD